MGEVVVTGGLGFIGSHVVDAYLARGDRVRIIDSQVGAVIDGEDYDDHPRCTVVRAAVEDYLADGGDFAGCDRVVHAAAHVGPAGILKHAGTLGVDIVVSTSAVVEACIAAEVPLCVFSSAEVYGRSGELQESDDIRVPIHYNARIEYAVAKTLTEVMTVNSSHRGLRAIVVRPFNVGGARQSRAGGFVMPTFVQQALAGAPLTVFATGEQTRAFLAATDLSRFLTDHMDAALDLGPVVVNVGNPGNRITVSGLAQRVTELLGSSSPIVRVDARTIHGPMYEEAESFHKVPVLGVAADLGWQPELDLDALILQTAEYYQRRSDVRAARAAV